MKKSFLTALFLLSVTKNVSAAPNCSELLNHSPNESSGGTKSIEDLSPPDYFTVSDALSRNRFQTESVQTVKGIFTTEYKAEITGEGEVSISKYLVSEQQGGERLAPLAIGLNVKVKEESIKNKSQAESRSLVVSGATSLSAAPGEAGAFLVGQANGTVSLVHFSKDKQSVTSLPADFKLQEGPSEYVFAEKPSLLNRIANDLFGDSKAKAKQNKDTEHLPPKAIVSIVIDNDGAVFALTASEEVYSVGLVLD